MLCHRTLNLIHAVGRQMQQQLGLSPACHSFNRADITATLEED
jgi:hypothetical protein